MNQLVVQTSLRIVLVTETWPPEINGVALSIYQLVSGLKAKGHQVYIVRPQQKNEAHHENNESELLVKGFAIPKYPGLQFVSPVYGQITKLLKSVKPDVVHIVTEGPLGLAALYAAKSANVAISSGFHSPFDEFSKFFGLSWLGRAVKAYLQFFHHRTEVTCVPSHVTLQHLKSWQLRCSLQLVSRGVNASLFSPQKRSVALRAQWGCDDQTTVVLTVSRLSPEKNINKVIEAYRTLQKQQKQRQLKLVIVGDGPDRANLQKLAPDAVFTGMLTGESLATHYASADVFCFPVF